MGASLLASTIHKIKTYRRDANFGNVPQQDARAPRAGRLRFWGGALVVFFCFAALTPRPLWQPHRILSARENIQIGEAQAWLQGRMDLPVRVHDTALFEGRVYSYFPPMFSLIAATMVPFFDGVPHLLVVTLVAAALLLTYVLMQQLTHSQLWSVVLTLGLICGTSAWPVIDEVLRGAPPYHINHLLSMIGLLMLLTQYFGPRSVWIGLIGLAMTALSRQLTVVFALPLAFMAYHPGNVGSRSRRVALAAVGCLVIGGGYLWLNAMKFGHPLTTGYMLNHEGRDDVFAREAREHGTLSLHWIPRNLYYANIGLPQVHSIHAAGKDKVYVRPNRMGTGIWWTSPILLWLFFDARRIAGDPKRLPIVFAAASLFGLLMLWHATGAEQRGYNRYSLDYMPALFALIVPGCLAEGRRLVTVAFMLWSIVYFVWILPVPYIRIW